MRLSLIVLRARDPERLANFYELFGCSFEVEQHGSSPVHYACAHDRTVFEIYPRSARQATTRAVRLGFEVADLSDACARAVASKGEILSGPKSTRYGRRAVLKDPEGHTLELTEPLA